jgi:hypothetical protein
MGYWDAAYAVKNTDVLALFRRKSLASPSIPQLLMHLQSLPEFTYADASLL